jgi:uncharacterized protein YdhG (YjbR/CyaY superfamily)
VAFLRYRLEMSTGHDDAARVEAYLEALPEQGRERVDQVRAAVHAAVPDLGERIAYGILTFTVDGRTAFHVGGYAAHTGLYPVPDDEALRERAAPWVAGKGTLRFPHRDELPMGLIEDVALWFAAAARDRGPR